MSDLRLLRTSIGEFTLQEYRLRLAGREWSVLHSEAVLTIHDEQTYLTRAPDARLPYGIVLWPSAIALAHDVAARGDLLRGRRVLELGAGTGLPGIVAASFGAEVVQTDRHELALSVCRRNGERNRVEHVTHRLGDWTDWRDDGRYDVILGADVLYSGAMHEHLRRIFIRNLAPGGRVLVSDPFRQGSLALLDSLESDGWRIALAKWSLGDASETRPVGVYELAPPALDS